jgi:hypothetical protein
LIIKNSNRNIFNDLINKISEYRIFKFRLISFTKVVVFLNIIVFVMVMYIATQHTWYVQRVIEEIEGRIQISHLKYYPKVFYYYLKGQFSNPESININIKHMDMEKLEYDRIKMVRWHSGVSDGVKPEFEYVSAQIGSFNKEVNVKMRLKGDRKIHYENLETASFRIKIKADNKLFGMKLFSIQKPRSRNYLGEWCFNKMMEDEGIISPRYEFINVIINGKNCGIYAMEEHYAKELIENNNNKEGPIIRFSESSSVYFKEATIEPFKATKWNEKENFPLAEKAINLLEAFRSNRLKISQVFDVKKMAMFFAIADLNDARHGLVTKSIRLYYNPITSRLEPIPFDGHTGTSFTFMMAAELGINPIKNWTFDNDSEWFRMFFNDPKSYDATFYKSYIQALRKLSNPEYLDNFFNNYHDEIENNLNIIYSEFPLHDNEFSFGPAPYYFERDSYYTQQNNISNFLKDTKGRAFFHSFQDNSILIDIQNNHKALPYEIVSLNCGENIFFPSEETVIIVTSKYGEIRYPKRVKFITNKKIDTTLENRLECITVTARYPGDSETFPIEVFPWKYADKTELLKDVTRSKSDLDKVDFINVDENRKEIKFIKDKINLESNLIFPSGYNVIIEEGTVINQAKGTIILSYSPIQMIGNNNNPIIVQSLNKAEPGQGIVIMQAQNKSFFKNVEFHNLGSPIFNNWELSGSIVLFESEIELDSVIFSNNRSEDALNIIRSKFVISNSIFLDIQSDAIDIDFGEGIISSTKFTNSGNDAIDISGSNVNINQIIIDNAGDKGISVGEKSRLKGHHVKVINTEIGIACKDLSDLELSNVSINDTKVGFTVFEKKPEYGPATININQLAIENVKIPYMIEKGSSMKVDGIYIDIIDGKVEDYLYGIEYGKRSN